MVNCNHRLPVIGVEEHFLTEEVLQVKHDVKATP